MRNLRKWSLVLVSLLLVFQLTASLGEAKPGPHPIRTHSEVTVVSQVPAGPPTLVDPANGIYKIDLVGKFDVTCDHPEYCTGLNTGYATVFSRGLGAVESVYSGYNQYVLADGASWTGTFYGHFEQIGKDRSRGETFATGIGTGRLAGYSITAQETVIIEISTNKILSYTGTGWVYPPGSK